MKKIVFIIFFIITFQVANAIEIVIKNNDGTDERRNYDISTERLEFLYGDGRDMVEIIGLEQLVYLKEIWLGMTASITDYRFITRLTNIEVIVFQDIQFNNIDFIYNIPSLKRLIFQGCRVNRIIDASRLPFLEYFEFTNSQLTEFPIIIREKRNIDTINVSYNNIRRITIPERMNILIIAWQNPVDNPNRNIHIDDSLFDVLPEKYRQYIR